MLELAVTGLVQQILDCPRELADIRGSHHSAAALECVKTAPDFAQRIAVSGIGTPHGKLAIDRLEHFARLLGENLEQLGVEPCFLFSAAGSRALRCRCGRRHWRLLRRRCFHLRLDRPGFLVHRRHYRLHHHLRWGHLFGNRRHFRRYRDRLARRGARCSAGRWHGRYNIGAQVLSHQARQSLGRALQGLPDLRGKLRWVFGDDRQ